MNAMNSSFAGCKIIRSNRPSFTLAPGIIAGLVAFSDTMLLLYTGYFILVSTPLATIEPLSMDLPAIVPYSLFSIALFYFGNLYKVESIIERRKSFSKIFLFCIFTLMVILVLAFVLKISSSFSPAWAFYWFISSLSGIYLVRLLARQCLLTWVQRGQLTRNIAIVGASTQGALMIEQVRKQQHPWVQIVGVFDDRSDRISEAIDQKHRLGSVDSLILMARVGRIDEILVALPWGAEERILSILHKLQVLPVNIRLCPESICYMRPKMGYSYCNGIATLNILDKPLSGWNLVLKTIEDKIFALFVLILIAPLLMIIAVLIKLDSPGPVLFRQKRYGFNNQLINMYKFRSMYINQQDDNARQLTTRDDPRVTKLGHFLRRTSLDELPQFLNVLTGEMSIVGPRPHAMEAKAAGLMYEDVVYQYAARHKVKPGITGWAQINGWRGDTDTEEKIQKRVDYDIDYINNWSITLDLKIILKTIFVVIIGQNAY
ncbi:Undecaprenyl-phosphate glucose phosphotransferase [Candidatus Methylobacter favarea]|uniref:Undecaprenyl-phosphate glucose phosphotransferase n=1 Tax=Candidatus Methylobacter favarea TaxID=2707345 RepID=A0A8S0WJL5_9GAMM|nr:undecaprenyl-phosphate glucose phosphotransferase [Candidatus Methylobacter favarea]CAA9891406.1 Undecaprenyl-phosphate glucose phosphotransferase [Candidatus Methylobacter favarea]